MNILLSFAHRIMSSKPLWFWETKKFCFALLFISAEVSGCIHIAVFGNADSIGHTDVNQYFLSFRAQLSVTLQMLPNQLLWLNGKLLTPATHIFSSGKTYFTCGHCDSLIFAFIMFTNFGVITELNSIVVFCFVILFSILISEVVTKFHDKCLILLPCVL